MSSLLDDNKFSVKIGGSRGGVFLSHKESKIYGGNTTSLQIISDKIPDDSALFIDTGTGFFKLSEKELKEKNVDKYIILFTHWHHDHTQGLFLSSVTFRKDKKKIIYGPRDGEFGIDEVLNTLFEKPLFPVKFSWISSNFDNHDIIGNPEEFFLLISKKTGSIQVTKEFVENGLKQGFFAFQESKEKIDVSEFLLISAIQANHPDKCLSYKFKDLETNKSFVFLTDHENLESHSDSFINHVKDANLLIMDSQYTREMYEQGRKGYGHGTPDYCIKVAEQYGAKKLGLTHHDPSFTDKQIKSHIGSKIKLFKTKKELKVFLVKDHDEYKL